VRCGRFRTKMRIRFDEKKDVSGGIDSARGSMLRRLVAAHPRAVGV
jgi:hypothetical protein